MKLHFYRALHLFLKRLDRCICAGNLETDEIRAAGLDVLSEEPMCTDNPLRGFSDSNRLLITPHIAWASIEARTKLMNIIAEQIKEFFSL